MIIRIKGPEGAVAIDDPKNFKAFSVRIEGAFASPEAEASALAAIALSRDADHVWVSEAALRAWPTLAGEDWWQTGLTGMMAAVERFGWIDRTNGTVRAHVERS